MTQTETRPWPTELRVRDKGAGFCVTFDNDQVIDLAAEYLRVESPSAEVKGHGPGQEVTVGSKRNVKITGVEPIGNYAVRITFDDGHSSGIYSWDYLMELAKDREDRWSAYLQKLEDKGLTRG